MRTCNQFRQSVILAWWLLGSLVLAGCGAKDANMARHDGEDTQRVAAADRTASGDRAVETSDSTPVGDTAPENAADELPPDTALPDTALPDSVAAEEPAAEQAGPAPSPSVTKGPRSIVRIESLPPVSQPATGALEPRKFEPAARSPYSMSPTMEMATESAPETEAPPRKAMPRMLPPQAPTGESGGPATGAIDSPQAGETAVGQQLPYRLMTVYYATDRQVVDSAAAAEAKRQVLVPLVVMACLTLLLLLFGWLGWWRRGTLGLATIGGLATLVLGGYWVWENREGLQQVADPGARYGNERGVVDYGSCQVTIPVSHATGEIERPSILRLEVREDLAKHVVLRATEPAPEDAFFEQLRSRVESAPSPEVFVFVHGYNVTFDGAARRTAQIAHDVQFAGAPIFFSWPSQGGLLKYTIDENNVEWAVPHLRQFLLDVAQRSGAKSVNLIAHSMGNRALTAALRDLQLQLGQEAMFNQIILAAPDIDAEIFKRDLAPALVRSARHVTLYASSNDQALNASRKVHGYGRAGDSGAGLVVLPGIETIDVSTLDTSLLGHSYYGSSDPILVDIRQMIELALPAAQRPFLLPRPYGELTYWVFEKIRTAAAGDLPRTTQ